MPPRASSNGFTLIEVLIATGILVTVAAGSAQLLVIAMRHDIASRQQLAMAQAAAAKIEELVGTIATAPPPAAAVGALDREADGCADAATFAGVALERRWIVAPLGGYAPSAVVVVVRVAAASTAGADVELATIAEARTP